MSDAIDKYKSVTLVLQFEGTAHSDYYDGALFTVEQDSISNVVPESFTPFFKAGLACELNLADAMYESNADGKRVRITAEVLE